MQRTAKLPSIGGGDILFTLKDVIHTPEAPLVKQPFTVRGNIELFSIPFLAPIWVQAKVTYPEEWWEEIIPIWGSPTVIESSMVIGGDFEIIFPLGFDREGEYILEVGAYAGPTFAINKLTLPPFPPVASEKTTFSVEGEVPPVKEAFDIKSVTVNERETTNKVTDTDFDFDDPAPMTTADKLSVNLEYQWVGDAREVTVAVRAGHKGLLPFDFVGKTDYYTLKLDLPSASELEPFTGTLPMDILVPLTKCGELDDGAIEIRIDDDYISQVWNVYATEISALYGFDLTEPTASPETVKPGEYVNITCPVTSRCTMPVTARAKVIIYQGSGWTSHGDKIREYESKSFTIEADEIKNVLIEHKTMEMEGYEGRDIEVEVYVEGSLAKESEWDDIFKVVAPDLELLKVDIDPPGSGYVTVTPDPVSGTQHNWYFLHGTIVFVTANPEEEYVFDKWSGEMKDTTDITAPVAPMTEGRVITAHFRKKVDIKDFSILKPTASPARVTAGQGVLISCPITSQCTNIQNIRVKCLIYEGSILPGHGDLIGWYWSAETYNISPGERIEAIFQHTTIEGTIDRRDVEVEVHIGGELVKEDEFDDLYYVDPVPPPAEKYTLTTESHPTGGGYVTGAGEYNANARVTVTATAYSGYHFDKWGGDASGTAASTTITMDGNKHAVALFKAVQPTKHTLSTAVSPASAGFIVKDPDKPEYDSGERVQLWAEVYSGEYAFDRWGGDASGNIQPITITMDRSKSVIAYLKEAAPPAGKYSLSIDMESTYGEVVGYVLHSPSLFAYPAGTVVNMTAYLLPEYEDTYGFSRWYVDGEVAGWDDELVITIDKNTVVIARFEWKGYGW